MPVGVSVPAVRSENHYIRSLTLELLVKAETKAKYRHVTEKDGIRSTNKGN
jgi:hypothetical protein